MGETDGSSLKPLEAFRSYLHVLARSRLPARVRRRIDASDVVQQTLLEAHRGRDDFRGHTPGEQAAWLRRILARNLADAIRHVHRAKRDVARERGMQDLLARSTARLEGWLAAEQSTPSDRMIREEASLRLADGIAALPEDQQEAVVLRHVRGLDLGEIAERMERSRRAVAGLLYRGLVGLRETLGGEAPA